MANQDLTKTKRAENDEFYTQWGDIESTMNAYLKYDPDVFKNKTVLLLLCDDPEWSNFTEGIVQNFERFGLRKLVSMSYTPAHQHEPILGQLSLFDEHDDPKYDPKNTVVNGKIFTLTHGTTNTRRINIEDSEWDYLHGNGNRCGEEVRAIRDEADIIIMNPSCFMFRKTSEAHSEERHLPSLPWWNKVLPGQVFRRIRLVNWRGGPHTSAAGRTPDRLNWWENRTANLMVILALVYLVLFSISVLWLSAPAWFQAIIAAGQLGLWLVFVADFAVRIWLAPHRRYYVLNHPLDLVTILLPAFRALRVLRVFAALRVMFQRGRRIEFGQVWLGIVAAVLFLVVVGSLVVLDAERSNPNALITTFPDALWWGFVTITTVGYGDEYPVTAVGQVSAVFLMVGGIGLLGTVTATLAAWFADKLQTRTDEDMHNVEDEIRALRNEVEGLRSELRCKHLDAQE